MRRRLLAGLVMMSAAGLIAAGAALYFFVNALELPEAGQPPEPLTVVSDARPVTVQTTAPDWRKVTVKTTVDRLRTDRTLWRRMHLDDWDRVAVVLREQALRNMLLAYGGVLQPGRWRDLVTTDWDSVPQPIRAVAFTRMIWHWARIEALGAEFDAASERLAQSVAAIVMAESWFEHRAVNVNPWGNRDLGLAQCSDHCRATISEMFEAGAITFNPRDDDYFNPLIGTRVATVWFERELLLSAGDVNLAIRAYHRGQENALDGQGDAYLARVLSLRDRYITAQTASASWRYLTAQVRAGARSSPAARQP
jgi:hypothetical protein